MTHPSCGNRPPYEVSQSTVTRGSPNITPANQSITVNEGSGPSQLTFNIMNPNKVDVTFGGVLLFQPTFLGGDDTDVPLGLGIGNGSCFLNFASGPGVKIAPRGSCVINFPFTTAIDEDGNNDSGTVRINFVTAFAEDVTGTQTSAFAFITVQDVPEPPTFALLLIAGAIGFGAESTFAKRRAQSPDGFSLRQSTSLKRNA